MFITRMNRLFAKHGRLAFGILIPFIIIPFVLYFSSGVSVTELLSWKVPQSHVSMYGKNISRDELARQTDLTLLSMSLSYGYPVDFRSSTARDMVQPQVLDRVRQLKAATALGLAASLDEVAKKIQESKGFQTNGSFDLAKFNNFAKYYVVPYGMTKGDIDQVVGEDVIIDKLRRQIGDSEIATEGEVREYYIDNNEQLLVDLLEFDAPNFLKQVKIDDKDVQAYFARNRANYNIPAKFKADIARFNYISKDVQAAAAKALTDERLKEQYAANQSKYENSETKPFDQVKDAVRKELERELFTVPFSELENAYQALVLKFREASQREAGVDFDGQVRALKTQAQHQKDWKRQITDKDLKAYYAKNTGKYQKRTPKPFDAVKAEIRAELMDKECEKVAANLAQKFAVEVYRQTEEQDGRKTQEIFTQLAKKEALTVAKADWFSSDSKLIQNVGKEPELIEAVAELYLSQPISNAVKGKNAAFVACLTARQDARQATFEEVKDKVIADYKADKSLKLARQAATEADAKLIFAMEKKESFKKASAGMAFKRLAEFTSRSVPSGAIDSARVKEVALKTKTAAVSGAEEMPQGAFIVHVVDRIAPSNEVFKQDFEREKTSFEFQKRAAAWQNYCLLLKQRSNTQIVEVGVEEKAR